MPRFGTKHHYCSDNALKTLKPQYTNRKTSCFLYHYISMYISNLKQDFLLTINITIRLV